MAGAYGPAMTGPPPPRNPEFDVPVQMTRGEAELLLGTLAGAWEMQFGPLHDVRRDIRLIYTSMFRPIARESTVRRALELAVQASPDEDLPDAMHLRVGAAQVVTPEARILIDVLERELSRQRGDDVDLADALATAERNLLSLYRTWSRERLHRVISLMAGDDAPLLPGPLGLIVMLLLRSAVGEEKALVQSRREEDNNVETSVVAGLTAFAKSIDPDAGWDARQFALYGGYALSEARRRLPSLVLDPAGRRRSSDSPPKRVFIAHGSAAKAAAFVARDLARRGVDSDLIGQALRAAVNAHGALATVSDGEAVRAREGAVLAALTGPVIASS